MENVVTKCSPSVVSRARRTQVIRTKAGPLGNDGFGPLALLQSALWFGLVTSGLELLVALGDRALFQRVTFDALRVNSHALWMIPAANLGIFIAWGAVFAVAGRSRSKAIARIACAVYGFLAALAPLLALHRLHPAACLACAVGSASYFATIDEARAKRLRKAVRFSLPALSALAMVWSGFQYQRVANAERHTLTGLPEAAPEAPNLLLIVLDTVRADHLSGYGYDRATAPRLERLARGGVQFENAFSTAPWTLPSHASILTGRWGHEVKAAADREMDPRFPTLAEYLRDRGYVTAGFVGNTGNCNARYGFDRGFAHYEDVPEKSAVSWSEILNCAELGRRLLQWTHFDLIDKRKDAPTINRDALAWLSRQEGRPFFLFLNYYDAHSPFVLPDAVPPRYGPAQRTPDQETFLSQMDCSRLQTLAPPYAAFLRDVYDDGVAYLDEQVGLLLDEMERRDLLSNTLVIVTADHGEDLGEHRLLDHGKSLYSQETHVPLLVAGLRGVPEGRKSRTAVSLRDLPATVADLLGLDAAHPFPGQSLARCWRNPEAPDDDAATPVFSEVLLQSKITKNRALAPALRGPMKSVILDRKKFIWHGDGQEELYDLANDPEEAHDLSGSDPARALLPKFRAALETLSQADRRTGLDKALTPGQ